MDLKRILMVLVPALIIGGLWASVDISIHKDTQSVGYSDYPNATLYNDIKNNSSYGITMDETDYMKGYEHAESNNTGTRQDRVEKKLDDRLNGRKGV